MTPPDAKPGTAAPSPDPFAAAKANIRDTIKWLTTTFAAVAGVVLAGSTFSGLGALPVGSRLCIAIGGALVGFILTLLCIARVLALLKSEAYFLGDLKDDPPMRKWVNDHAEDLLPAEFATVEAFLEARKDARTRLMEYAASDEEPDEDERALYVRYYREMDRISARLTSYLHFQKLANRLKEEAAPLLALAAFAILGLATFAWAVSPPKPAASSCACCITSESSTSARSSSSAGPP